MSVTLFVASFLPSREGNRQEDPARACVSVAKTSTIMVKFSCGDSEIDVSDSVLRRYEAMRL